jgi:hypothetical protein
MTNRAGPSLDARREEEDNIASSQISIKVLGAQIRNSFA